MKTKILVSALICASVGYVNAETPPHSTQKEKVMSEPHQTDKTQKKISNKDEPIDSSNFDTKSKAEQNAYINKVMSERDANFKKFNLDTFEQPQLSDDELKVKESQLDAMLVQCSNIIGLEDWEKKFKLEGYDFFNSKPTGIIYDSFSDDDKISSEFARRAQPHYLSNKIYKCAYFLFTKQYVEKRADPAYGMNFEYSRIMSEKEKKVANLYEKIYLTAKEAGLLSRMENAYFPKSLLREHADATGLTLFIKEKESQANHTLKHDELAIQFFGSREAWLTNLNQYLVDKINFR